MAAAWRLRRMVIREGYDVIETSGPTPSALTILALQGTKVRHVVGIHQVFRKDRDTNSSLRALRQLARLDRRANYYAVSRAAAEAWVEFAHVAPPRVRVAYNSIAQEFFDPTVDREEKRKALGVPPGAKLALYVGRLANYKGMSTILHGLLPILEARNLVLLYVGEVDEHVSGSAEEVKSLQATVERAGLGDRVRWLGHRTDVRDILAAADLLLHPTSIEAFGLVLVEALAAGVPVVASNVEGIPEVLEGTQSIMVPPCDSHALREAVETVLGRSGDECLRAARAGIARARDFRPDRRIERMLEILNTVRSGSS